MLASRLSIDAIIGIVKEELGENEDFTKKVSIFFCRKGSGRSIEEPNSKK